MNANHTLTEPTEHKLSVVCYGRTELPEDDPVYGTYRTRGVVHLGVCVNLDSAITLAERSIALPPLTLIRSRRVLDFAPERIIIRDSKSRLVLAGEITRTYLVWLPPITSDDETYIIRAAAGRLHDEASFERGWDNYSTAEGLERRAEFLEGHLVDPVWQTEVANSLKRRAKSLQGPARTYPRIDNTCMNDFD